MVNHGGPQDLPQTESGLLPAIPAMPVVPRGELWRDTPYLLSYSLRHGIGWQDDRKAGPGFVVTRLTRFDSMKVTERFPLTAQGWADAWQVLAGRDAAAATAIAAALSEREGRDRASAALAALDAKSSCYLRQVTYNGGSGESRLAKGRAYDLRFLSEGLIVCPPKVIDAIVELRYPDVETVEVSGSDKADDSGSSMLLWMLALGLLGALLGLLVFRLAGLFFGALIFGGIGAAVGANPSRIETTVRIRGKDFELYFLSTEKRPDALRIEMSGVLRAIETAHAPQAADAHELATPAPDAVPDRLTQLASLLQQDLITREEFEHLKAKLIAES